jgi:hypothetical protein
MPGFAICGVETSGSATRELVKMDIREALRMGGGWN